MNKRSKRICDLWNEIEDDFPDKSTEWLMAMVCDHYLTQYGHEIDNGDVAEALYQESLND